MKIFLRSVITCLFLGASASNAQGFLSPYHERFAGLSTEKIKVFYVRHEGVGGIEKGQGITRDLLEHGHKLCSIAMSTKGMQVEPLDLVQAEKYSRRIKELYLANPGWVLTYSIEVDPVISMEENCKVVADIRARAAIIRPQPPGCHFIVLDGRNGQSHNRTQKNNAGPGCGAISAQPASFLMPDAKQRAVLNPDNQLEKCTEIDPTPILSGRICRSLLFPTMDAVLKRGSFETQYPVVNRFEAFQQGKLMTRYSAVKQEEIMVGKDFFSLPAEFHMSVSGKK